MARNEDPDRRPPAWRQCTGDRHRSRIGRYSCSGFGASLRGECYAHRVLPSFHPVVVDSLPVCDSASVLSWVLLGSNVGLSWVSLRDARCVRLLLARETVPTLRLPATLLWGG